MAFHVALREGRSAYHSFAIGVFVSQGSSRKFQLGKLKSLNPKPLVKISPGDLRYWCYSGQNLLNSEERLRIKGVGHRILGSIVPLR